MVTVKDVNERITNINELVNTLENLNIVTISIIYLIELLEPNQITLHNYLNTAGVKISYVRLLQTLKQLEKQGLIIKEQHKANNMIILKVNKKTVLTQTKKLHEHISTFEKKIS